MQKHTVLQPDWNRIDQAALGLIYGSITVLSLLLALEEAPATPHRPAIVLFGSVFAVTLAKVFSEVLAHAVQTHERILTRTAWTTALRGTRPILAVANMPTIVILAAGFGWISFAFAVSLSQVFCVVVLVLLGIRIGWAIHPKSWLPLGGAIFVGGIGSALAALKFVIH